KRYVANIPGRGYRFVARMSLSGDEEPGGAPPGATTRAYDLPAPPTRMLGRDDIVNSLISQLPQRRFITLVGPGGIGKTTVALAAAERSTASYRDGVCFVDLVPLTDPLLVPSALAFVLGLAIRSDNPIPGLVAFLRDKKMLLVLDSCDHVIDAAASLAEQVLRGAPGVHMLTTSREALRAQGERVQRLGPLGVPAVSAGLTAAEAMTLSGGSTLCRTRHREFGYVRTDRCRCPGRRRYLPPPGRDRACDRAGRRACRRVRREGTSGAPGRSLPALDARPA